MNAKKLAEELLKFPEFDVDFSLFEVSELKNWPQLRTFEIRIDDIGYSEKIIKLGAEYEK